VDMTVVVVVVGGRITSSRSRPLTRGVSREVIQQSKSSRAAKLRIKKVIFTTGIILYDHFTSLKKKVKERDDQNKNHVFRHTRVQELK